MKLIRITMLIPQDPTAPVKDQTWKEKQILINADHIVAASVQENIGLVVLELADGKNFPIRESLDQLNLRV